MSKQRLARWVVRAIEVVFSSAGVHASWALFKVVPLELVCAAAGWISSLTFSRFNHLNVASSLATSVLHAGEGISL